MLIRCSLTVLIVTLMLHSCADGQVHQRVSRQGLRLVRVASRTSALPRVIPLRVPNRRSLPTTVNAVSPRRRIVKKRPTTANPTVSLKPKIDTTFTQTPRLPVIQPNTRPTTLRPLPRRIPLLTPPPITRTRARTVPAGQPPAIRPPPGVAGKLNLADSDDFMRLARFLLRRRRTQQRRARHGGRN